MTNLEIVLLYFAIGFIVVATVTIIRDGLLTAREMVCGTSLWWIFIILFIIAFIEELIRNIIKRYNNV